MRGGTSKAIMFHARDLPADRQEWDAIFLSAMGSPDPHGRQLDGMGGGISSLSKVRVIAPSQREDADVDYTFAQVQVKQARVDYGANCGNMSAAVAARIDGSVVWQASRRGAGNMLRLAMPSGVLTVGAQASREGGAWQVAHGSFYRSARRLFEGHVCA